MERATSHVACGLAVLCLAAAGIGCSNGKSGEKGVVSGTVNTTQSMTLPADASVKVQLADVSQADAASHVVAETTLTTAGQQFPVPFELSYASDTIDPQHNYAVRATVESGGKTLYTTDTVEPVITGGNDNQVSLTVVSTDEMADTTGDHTTALADTEWQLTDLSGSAIVADSRPTLKFTDDGKVEGNGTCNNFNGPVTMQGATMTIGALVSTKRACAEEAKNAQETAYLAALQDADRFQVEGTTLTVSTKSGGLLHFTRTKPAP
jgi:putative lipoprotein